MREAPILGKDATVLWMRWVDQRNQNNTLKQKELECVEFLNRKLNALVLVDLFWWNVEILGLFLGKREFNILPTKTGFPRHS